MSNKELKNIPFSSRELEILYTILSATSYGLHNGIIKCASSSETEEYLAVINKVREVFK